jgi:Rad3-related DNA helicase
MTSATSSVARPDFAYFRERIGATEAKAVQLGSPFDFQKQMKIFVVQKMPEPARRRLHQTTRTLDRAFRGEDRRLRVRAFHQLSRHATGRGRDGALFRRQEI